MLSFELFLFSEYAVSGMVRWFEKIDLENWVNPKPLGSDARSQSQAQANGVGGRRARIWRTN